jgi:hypothetical protein
MAVARQGEGGRVCGGVRLAFGSDVAERCRVWQRQTAADGAAGRRRRLGGGVWTALGFDVGGRRTRLVVCCYQHSLLSFIVVIIPVLLIFMPCLCIILLLLLLYFYILYIVCSVSFSNLDEHWFHKPLSTVERKDDIIVGVPVTATKMALTTAAA